MRPQVAIGAAGVGFGLLWSIGKLTLLILVAAAIDHGVVVGNHHTPYVLALVMIGVGGITAILAGGGIVELGSHDELVAASGRYAAHYDGWVRSNDS